MRLYIAVCALSTTFVQLSRADCFHLPTPVSRYLATQKPWAILKGADLGENQSMWTRYHGTRCPGFARVNFYGESDDTYAVALIREEGSLLHERLSLITAKHEGLIIRNLTPSWDVTGPWVVFRTVPGVYKDVLSGKNFTLRLDGVIFERMESADHLYYLDHDRIGDVMLSD